MYSVVLMAALTAGGGQTPAWFHHGCCGGGYGGCYGSCFGGCYGSGYGGCSGSSCHGGFLGLRNHFSCHGGCHGWGSCHGGGGCHGSSYGCYGSCYGSGYGGCWGSSYGAGCYGCGGGGYMAGPGYVTPNIPAPNPATSGTNAPSAPGVKPTTAPKPMGGTGTALSQPARVIVSLPADAKLFVDDQPMVSTSATRTFRTPELVPGQVYYYIMRAEIVRDGKALNETKQVLVRAGDQNQVAFTDLAKADTASHVAKSDDK